MCVCGSDPNFPDLRLLPFLYFRTPHTHMCDTFSSTITFQRMNRMNMLDLCSLGRRRSKRRYEVYDTDMIFARGDSPDNTMVAVA